MERKAVSDGERDRGGGREQEMSKERDMKERGRWCVEGEKDRGEEWGMT